MKLQILLWVISAALTACTSEKKEWPAYESDPSIEKLVVLDEKLGSPQTGDWLDAHFEPGQSFEEYLMAEPVTPTEARNKIYIQPIGNFSYPENKLIAEVAEYLQIFFNLQTAVLPVLSDSIVPTSARRKTDLGDQLKTGFIMDYLFHEIPHDGIVIMAITTQDLYPSANFNFVFGQARTKSRVGVTSFNRFKDGPLDSANYSLCLNRLIKTSAHEIGHMFTCLHCTHAVCLMNGSNSLSESDLRSNRLCSDCLRKLHWNLRFDVKLRLAEIAKYFENHNLRDDYILAIKDLSVIE